MKQASVLSLPPVDRAWASFIEAQARYEAHYAEYIKLTSNKTESGWREDIDYASLLAFDKKLDQYRHVMFQAYDIWHSAKQTSEDKTISNVPRSDVASLVTESISESAAGIAFSLNFGLVAHKLTEALYGFAVREDSQEMPLCRACA